METAADTDPSTVEYELNQTIGLLSSLSEGIQSLEKRISSVLLPPNPGPSSNSVNSTTRSDLSQAILENNMRLSDLIQQLTDLQHRVNL